MSIPWIDSAPDLVCKHYNYSSWFELISPCFESFVHKEENKNCQPTMLSKNLSSRIHKVIEELNMTITNSPNLTKEAEKMWKAVQRELFRDWCPGPFHEIVHYLKVVLTQAPPYLPNAPNFYGVPISNMLLCYLHTQEGRSFFASPKVNSAMVKIVNTYGEFLETKESLNVLNNGTFGWKGPCALKELDHMKEFVYNKEDKYWGFKSWNDFFTRNLKNGTRPIVGRDNNKIVNAFGDNGFLNIEMHLQNNTKMWIKNESYSLFQMFDKNPSLSNRFIGGTALQVFFSATKYHHYHAPVSGNVTYAANKHGIIYAVDEVNVASNQDKLTTLKNWIKYGADGLIETELYLAHIASRAIIIIENELLGPVALFFIGMTEISSCRIEPRIKNGYENGTPAYVEKGDKLGYFQFGGSSGAILFTKEVVDMRPKPFWNMSLLHGDIKMGQPILYI